MVAATASLSHRRVPFILPVLLFAVACGEVDDTPDVPLLTIEKPNGDVQGEYAIRFNVADKQSRLVNVDFQQGIHQPNQAATAAQGMPLLRGLRTSPGGIWHVFGWDSQTDYPFVRESRVHLSATVDAGDVEGVGDSIGPLVVDNTGQPRQFDVTVNITRATVFINGTPTGSLIGTLYASYAVDAMSPPLDAVRLGVIDFTDPTTRVQHTFSNVPAGSYRINVLLDRNNNTPSPTSVIIDVDDLINSSGNILLSDQGIQVDVRIDLVCTNAGTCI